MDDLARSLFWVLQETDIENEDLFLPADTPIGNVHPNRFNRTLRKRLENERKRLIDTQTQELQEYQSRFSHEKEQDLIVKPSMVFIQDIPGDDFLRENASLIADIINIQPSQYNHHPRTASVDESIIKANDEIKERQKKFQDLLKSDYKDGFALLNRRHIEQIKRLEEFQKEDLGKSPSDKINGEMKSVSLTEQEQKAIDIPSERTQLKRSISADEEEYVDPKKKKLQDSVAIQSSPQLQQENIPETTNKYPKKNSPTIPLSTRKTIAPTKKSTPISIPSRTPTPILAPSNTDSPPPSSFNSNTPLFAKTTNNLNKAQKRDMKSPKKIISLIDKGPISIRSKPNRVMIKGVNYGDPKDFDDAINGVIQTRKNPITKRYMQGNYYLFHNSEENGVVNLGPVSKIQPLIQKFFLSM